VRVYALPDARAASVAVGKDLAAARHAARITPSELGRRIGRSAGSVVALERGERQHTVAHVEAVLRATGRWGA